MRLRLVRPSLKYFRSFRKAMVDLGDQPVPTTEYLRKTADTAGIDPVEFWLVDDDRYLGRIFISRQAIGRKLKIASHLRFEIRPSITTEELGPRLLMLGVRKAQLLQINPVIVCCAARDRAYRAAIEHNRGELVRAVRVTRYGKHTTIRVYAFTSAPRRPRSGNTRGPHLRPLAAPAAVRTDDPVRSAMR